MNHKYTTMALAAIVATVAITAVGFAIPQQVMAHYGHHYHHHNNDRNNGIRVDQAVNQLNTCSNSTCLNDGTNDASIHGR
jgi:hypothetical protein